MSHDIIPPQASLIDPFVAAALAGGHRADGYGERYGDRDESGHLKRWVYEHPEVDEQRIDPLAVHRDDLQSRQRVGEEQHHAEEECQHQRGGPGGVWSGVGQLLANGRDG